MATTQRPVFWSLYRAPSPRLPLAVFLRTLRPRGPSSAISPPSPMRRPHLLVDDADVRRSSVDVPLTDHHCSFRPRMVVANWCSHSGCASWFYWVTCETVVPKSG